MSVSEDMEGCEKCRLHWSGCRSYRDRVFDYISTGGDLSMLLTLHDLKVDYGLEMRISAEIRPLPFPLWKLEKWALSDTQGTLAGRHREEREDMRERGRRGEEREREGGGRGKHTLTEGDRDRRQTDKE